MFSVVPQARDVTTEAMNPLSLRLSSLVSEAARSEGDLVGVIFFVISQCLSASHVHVNHLGVLLKHSFCFNRSEWSPEFLTDSKVIGTLLV